MRKGKSSKPSGVRRAAPHPAEQYLDIFSDPVDGITRINAEGFVFGGAGSRERVSGECADNEYRTVGNRNFGAPGSVIEEGLLVSATWRHEVIRLTEIERTTMWYRQSRREGEGYLLFQIELRYGPW